MATTPCTDHLGNKFESITSMCKHWGIGLRTFQYRMKQGLTLEQTLTTPIKDLTVTDHLGNKFESKKAM